MNKQEAIEKIYETDLYGLSPAESKKAIILIVSQIDEPQKVVVPKFVAEWIEECKSIPLSLDLAFNSPRIPEDVAGWLIKFKNQEIFARAWLDGYEVEKEQLYVVTDGNKLYLKQFDELNAVIIIDDVLGATDYAKQYSDKTEAQKAADELGWVVKEVTNEME